MPSSSLRRLAPLRSAQQLVSHVCDELPRGFRVRDPQLSACLASQRHVDKVGRSRVRDLCPRCPSALEPSVPLARVHETSTGIQDRVLVVAVVDSHSKSAARDLRSPDVAGSPMTSEGSGPRMRTPRARVIAK